MSVDEEADTTEGIPFDVDIRFTGKGVGSVGAGFNMVASQLGVDIYRVWGEGFRGTIEIKGILFNRGKP